MEKGMKVPNAGPEEQYENTLREKIKNSFCMTTDFMRKEKAPAALGPAEKNAV